MNDSTHLNDDPNELSDYVPASRWAIRSLIRVVGIACLLVGFALGFLARGFL